MKVDHVTYQVPYGGLEHSGITTFFGLLEMKEIKPDDEVEKGWKVRWFVDADGFQVHLVEAENNQARTQEVRLGLGHFCAVLSRHGYREATESTYCTRNSGMHSRAWLEGPFRLRAEIRPKALDMEEAEPVEVKGTPFFLDLGDGDTTEDRLAAIFAEAHGIFVKRNRQHQDSWKREGLRGCLFNLRRKVERAWDYLFNADFTVTPADDYDEDDMLDAINYAALAVLAKREGNRDGQGGWWN